MQDFKRLFDLVISLLMLILLSPVMLVIAILVRARLGKPVLFSQERPGRHGNLFRLYKFRTMRDLFDAEGKPLPDEERLTPFGRFLRASSLDELPELFNVIKGEMSLVGPRPEVKKFTDLYNEEEKVILTVQPGITDWASIWNSDEGAILSGVKDPDKVYSELIRPTKLKLQIKYVKERSFWVDLKIRFLTVLAILKPVSKAVGEIRGGRDNL